LPARAVEPSVLVPSPDPLPVPETEFPEGRIAQRWRGHRTTLATPLLREGVPIGGILIRRMEVRPFTDKQIALLKTFADQAVIAIENVRLFTELQASNRDLTTALDQQTATAKVRPFRTNSTSRARNSGGYGRWLFGIVDAPFHPNSGASTKPGQLHQSGEHVLEHGLGQKLGQSDQRLRIRNALAVDPGET
jgi:hypothetical protein